MKEILIDRVVESTITTKTTITKTNTKIATDAAEVIIEVGLIKNKDMNEIAPIQDKIMDEVVMIQDKDKEEVTSIQDKLMEEGGLM